MIFLLEYLKVRTRNYKAKDSIFGIIELMMLQAGINKHQASMAFDTIVQLIKFKYVRTRR